MKKLLAAMMSICLLFSAIPASAEIILDTESGETLAELTSALPVEAPYSDPYVPTVSAKSYVMMELSTGTVLSGSNEHDKLPIASVTKIMTLLLTMEAIDNGQIELTDEVSCSANAASMGGSQIWLKEGEIMTVHELIKAAAVVSANDACAALAEHICGSVESFVKKMNERAAALQMKDTLFLDCSGLNDEAHSSAYDVALMSRELMRHPLIKEYTTIWMDTLRDGKSQLVNTNKLVRFYEGATGLKTGTTAAAGHCLAATAERNGIAFAVILLGGPSAKQRFADARKLLDYGFANYALYTPPVDLGEDQQRPVSGGTKKTVTVVPEAFDPILINKGEEKEVTLSYSFKENLAAPISKGQELGRVSIMLPSGEKAGLRLVAAEDVKKRDFLFCIGGLLKVLWQ